MKETPNLEYIKELAGGAKSFEDKFIAIIKAEFPNEKREYLKNLHEKKYRETSENVHKLKHKLNILGLQQGYRLAVRHEEDLRYEDAKLKDEFVAILDVIEDFIQTL